jgi:hypothetical protein
MSCALIQESGMVAHAVAVVSSSKKATKKDLRVKKFTQSPIN